MENTSFTVKMENATFTANQKQMIHVRLVVK